MILSNNTFYKTDSKHTIQRVHWSISKKEYSSNKKNIIQAISISRLPHQKNSIKHPFSIKIIIFIHYTHSKFKLILYKYFKEKTNQCKILKKNIFSMYHSLLYKILWLDNQLFKITSFPMTICFSRIKKMNWTRLSRNKTKNKNLIWPILLLKIAWNFIQIICKDWIRESWI